MEANSKNYVVSPERAQELGEMYLNGPMKEYIRLFMNRFPAVQSVLIKVSQYYDDEASDAVHFRMYPSVLPVFKDNRKRPKPVTDKKGRVHQYELSDVYYDDDDGVRGVVRENLPFLKNEGIPVGCLSDFIHMWEEYLGYDHPMRRGLWYANSLMISLFSAYCSEEGGRGEYEPLCIYRRESETFEFVGKVIRPALLGIRPEYYDDTPEDGGDFEEQFKALMGKVPPESDVPVVMVKHLKHWGRPGTREDRGLRLNLVGWSHTGPYVREDLIPVVTGQPHLLYAMKTEWDRRKAWDSAFAKDILPKDE